jgi:hypothetical protein
MASFAVLLTPYIASAHDGYRNRHPRISANEMATAGFAAAAMIGVVGFLALRKRTSL